MALSQANSLRERNKAATRSALAEAALQLAMRDGLDVLRTDDISERAGVSPRTFSNHFASEYEALTFRHIERMRYAAEALRARPAGEPLWTAIRGAVSAPWVEAGQGALAPPPATVAELRLVFGDRALQGEILKEALDPRNAFAVAVAERLGLDAGRDLYPRLVASAVTLVTQVAIDVRQASSSKGQVMDVTDRLGFKALSADLTDFCKDAVSDLVLGSGAGAFRSDSMMQRMFRNVNMISIHAFFDTDASMEGYGRVLLGLESNTPV